jgi:hypothetical protein
LNLTKRVNWWGILPQWKKLLISIAGGFLAALLLYLVIALALKNHGIGWLFFILLILISYLLYKRTSRAKHAAGWACVLLAIGSFAFPIATLFYSASLVAEAGNGESSEAIAQQVGTGIGAMIITGIGAIVGLFFGIIFVVLAYFLLKDSKKKEEKK